MILGRGSSTIGATPVASLWALEPIQAVQRLRQLPEGWDRAGSPSPGNLAIDGAIEVINGVVELGLDDFPVPRIFPVPGGGVQIEWGEGDRELEIEVLPSGRAEYVKGIQGQPTEEGDVLGWNPAQMKALFAWLVSSE